MTVFGILWLTLFVVVLGLEGFALNRDAKGDTLSEQVWGLARRSRAFVGALSATLVWLLWHFLIEPRFFPGLHLTTFTDDIVLAVVVSGLGWAAGPVKAAGQPR